MPRGSAARAAEPVAPSPKAVEKGSPRRTGASITRQERPVWMDLDFIRGLIEAVDQSGIDTLDVHREGIRLRISKSPPVARPAANGAAVAAPAPAIAAPPAQPAAPAAPPVAPPKSNLIEVKSPMVGTFYRAPAPEAPSYVEFGSTIRKGETLCILEAMKLMNELNSEVDGIVREILAENADPVEYGQVLFRIEPAGLGVAGRRTHVSQNSDRQSRRDRSARHSRLPRAGHSHRGGIQRSRSRIVARAVCR